MTSPARHPSASPVTPESNGTYSGDVEMQTGRRPSAGDGALDDGASDTGSSAFASLTLLSLLNALLRARRKIVLFACACALVVGVTTLLRARTFTVV